MNVQHVTEVPEVRFNNRRIYIESFGNADKDSLRVAKGLSMVLKDKFFNKNAIKEPRIVTPFGRRN